MIKHDFFHTRGCLNYLVEQAIIGIKVSGDGDEKDIDRNAQAVNDFIDMVQKYMASK